MGRLPTADDRLRKLHEEFVRPRRARARGKPGTCRVCGCTDDRACAGGCWWVETDLCRACAPTKGAR